MKKSLCILSVLIFVCGCQERNSAVPQKPQPQTVFTTSVANFYGAFYENGGVESNVISLDLFSEGIVLDERGYMQGSGSNLYVSDIFLSPQDTFLLPATYSADTSALPLTFLGGINYEGNITGAYLLNLQESALESYEIFPNGTFLLTEKADSVFIDFELTRTDNSKYKATYKGTIPYYDYSAKPKEEQQQQRQHLLP